MDDGVKHESPKAAAAFAHYCAYGSDRSLVKLAAHLGHPVNYVVQLEIWSRTYNWQQRVKSYDIALIERKAEEKRQKHDQEIEKMNERHAQIGVTQQLKAIQQIDELVKAKAFGSIAAVQLLKLAIEAERAARGESTKTAIEILGKDGKPLESHIGHVAVYLPQKDTLPSSKETTQPEGGDAHGSNDERDATDD